MPFLCQLTYEFSLTRVFFPLCNVEYEIIEVNGFAIKRRKSETKEKTTPGSQVGQITGGTTSQVFQTPVDTKTVETPVQRTPNVDEYEISVELYDRLTKALHEFPESGPSSARLLAICSSVCGAEMDTVGSQLDGTTLACLESIFGDFLNKLSQAVDDGSIQVAENVPDDGLTEADFKVDIRSRKLGLQRRLDMLEKVGDNFYDTCMMSPRVTKCNCCRRSKSGMIYWKKWIPSIWKKKHLHQKGSIPSILRWHQKRFEN